MLKKFLTLLAALAFAHAADTVPAKEVAPTTAPLIKPGNPSGDPDAPAPTVDPTKNVPVPEAPKPEAPTGPDRKKKKKV